MLAVLDLVTQVAPSRSTVLISGESGTGKELIAKAIHSASTRADKAFIPINTGSIPVDLLESQLFGHVKGAFTSAMASKKGLFEVADQGTIFFDEISTISPETQAKLLRVIQEREFMRLGGTETIKVDVRILAASNEDLPTLVREGRFREDLYHRLNVISIQLPPLRERKEDIPLMVERFLERFCRENGKPPRGFTHGAMKLLMDYDWPGNVRELENVVERAVVLSTQEAMDVDLLPKACAHARSSGAFACSSPNSCRRSRAKPARAAPGPLPRSSRFSRKSSAASSWTCSSAPTGTRRKPPSASRSRSRRSTRKSSAWASKPAAAPSLPAAPAQARRFRGISHRQVASGAGLSRPPPTPPPARTTT